MCPVVAVQENGDEYMQEIYTCIYIYIDRLIDRDIYIHTYIYIYIPQIMILSDCDCFIFLSYDFV